MITRETLRLARQEYQRATREHENARLAFQEAAATAREAQKNWEAIRDAFVLEQSQPNEETR